MNETGKLYRVMGDKRRIILSLDIKLDKIVVSDRRQRVVINGCNAEWIQVISWVPQESLLGSLLFLICTNDVDGGINSDINKLADDTKIGRLIRSDSDAIALQADLDRMNK